MTVQRSNAITLEEISGIQLECRKCKVKVNAPLSGKWRLPIKCSYCGDEWIVDNRTDLHARFFTAVNELIAAMKQIADISPAVNCIFSVEVKPEIRSLTETGASRDPAV